MARRAHNPGRKAAEVKIKCPDDEKVAAQARARALGVDLSAYTRGLWALDAAGPVAVTLPHAGALAPVTITALASNTTGDPRGRPADSA